MEYTNPTIAAIAGVSGEGFADRILGQAGLLTILNFSRDQETEADEAARFVKPVLYPRKRIYRGQLKQAV